MRRLILALTVVLAACQGADQPRPVVTEERPRAVANRDDVLKNVVARKIAESDRAAFRAVTVEVWGGRAVLLGAVVKPEHRRRAEQAARSVDGVVSVANELVLAELPALEFFLPEFAKEDAVRRHLGIEGKAGLVVRVINGVAFLIGGASPDAAAQLKADAGEVDGIKWVVTHIYQP